MWWAIDMIKELPFVRYAATAGIVPDMAFEIVLNVASLGILASWATIVICQLQLFRWSEQGRMERPSFRMWGAPYTGYLTLVFLLSVLVLMAFNYPVGTAAIAGLAVLIPVLAGGWYLVRDRVAAIADGDRP